MAIFVSRKLLFLFLLHFIFTRFINICVQIEKAEEKSVSAVLFISTFQHYDKVINFSLYVNKVEIDKILRKFVGRKLHPCIIHVGP